MGNVSAWTEWRALIVDLTSPSVLLSSGLDDALADGFLGPDELLLSGNLQDETAALAVDLCLIEAGRQTCRWLGAPGGAWQYNSAGFQAGDGISQTLTVRGFDAAGNVSATISRTYTVDTVAPVISATQSLDLVDLADYQPGNPGGPPVLGGTMSDGSGVASVTIRLRQPDGSVISQTVPLVNGEWTFVPELTMPGNHLLTVEATDVAGNVSSRGGFVLMVEGAAQAKVYLPLVIR